MGFGHEMATKLFTLADTAMMTIAEAKLALV